MASINTRQRKAMQSEFREGARHESRADGEAQSLYPFVLTEEQEQLRREIRTFAAREIAPNVMKWDEASEFPLATIKELGKLWDCWA